jgi:hypothetical protein
MMAWNLRGGICRVTGRPKMVRWIGIAYNIREGERGCVPYGNIGAAQSLTILAYVLQAGSRSEPRWRSPWGVVA